MASDSVGADTALLPEAVQVPESDDETSPTAVHTVSAREGESAADEAAPELVEFRRKRSEALEQLRALYRLPEAEGTFADIAMDLMSEGAKRDLRSGTPRFGQVVCYWLPGDTIGPHRSTSPPADKGKDSRINARFKPLDAYKQGSCTRSKRACVEGIYGPVMDFFGY